MQLTNYVKIVGLAARRPKLINMSFKRPASGVYAQN